MDETPAPFEQHPWYGVVRAANVTCRWCTEPTGGKRDCRHCLRHHAIRGVADVVAPVTYAIAGTTTARRLRDYKDHPSRTVRQRRSDEIALLLGTVLDLHEGCLECAVDIPLGLRVTVPSLTLRPGLHPFARLASAVTETTPQLLSADPSTDCHRAVSAHKFRVANADTVSGRHVLVLDDLWTTGSNAQSAALALRAAGAAAVSVLVIGRWLNPSYSPTRLFLRRSLAAYDPARCPLTGGVCEQLSDRSGLRLNDHVSELLSPSMDG